MSGDSPSEALNGEVMSPRVGDGSAARLENIDTERLVIGDRMAFVKVMADMLACAPSVETMRKFADKYPDRWAYALKLLGGLMGLAEKVEHEGTIVHRVVNMSDAELMKNLDEMKFSLNHKMNDG